MSSGTGFLVSADGAILTAFHIVDGAKSMKAVDVDGRILAAKVVAAQPRGVGVYHHIFCSQSATYVCKSQSSQSFCSVSAHALYFIGQQCSE